MKTALFLHTALTTLMIAFFFHLASAQNSFPTPSGACLLDATGAAAGNGGELRLAELDANGANYVGWKAPDKLTGDQIYVFPNGFPSGSGKVLSSDNTGALSWVKRANSDLSNLDAITHVNAALLPNANNTLDFGNGANSWKDIYLDGAIYLDDAKFISNAGTTSAFIGYQAGNSNTGTSNSAFGYQAMFSNTTGDNNTAVGSYSLYSNTTGNYNAANGLQALYFNTTGYSNTASGYRALYSNTTGFENTANGSAALYSNTTGNYNTANGRAALYYNTTGSYNTANGYYALSSNTTGTDNTAIGYRALSSNTLGSHNTANGGYSLRNNTIADDNSAFGYYSLYNCTTGPYNSSFGYSSLYSNTTGGDNSAFGYVSLYSNTTGTDNSASGYKSLYSNTTGNRNSAFGFMSLYSSTTGSGNTASGSFSLEFNTTGHDNTAMGYFSLLANTTGYYNTALGYASLYENTTGINNTASGNESLGMNTTGSGNTASGDHALYLNTTGDYNTSSGSSAGSFNDANTNCSFFGYDADQSVSTNFDNSTALGKTSRITASNQVRIGNSNVTSIGGYEPWTDLSDNRFKKQIQENVPGLEFINKLKPVTYHLDVTGLRKFLGEDITGEEDTEGFVEQSAEHRALIDEAVKKKEQIIYTGFIAQEVEASAKELGYDFSGVDAPQNEHSLYGLRYSQFVVPLVKAVQELSQRNEGLKTEDVRQKSKVDSLQFEVYSLQKENTEIKNQITQLQTSIENIVTLRGVEGQKLSMTDGYAKLQTLNSKPETILGQNIPNPFDNSTLIPFRIPKDCNDASIMVVEQGTGRVVTMIPITCDETHVQIHAGTLASGMYSYTLYVDGKMIDTKQMELFK